MSIATVDVTCVANARTAFQSGRTRPYAWRMDQLKALRRLLVEKNDDFNRALWSDLRKGSFEAAISEQGLVIDEVDYALDNLQSWMQPKKAATPLIDQPGTSYIHAEPYGVALIIGAWNYPVNLLLAPLVGAIAGGNTVVLKPSELAPATSAAMARWIPEYLDKEAVFVFEGGVPETDSLLNCVFDYIFFTGSGPVGRIVLRKAAEHLTPVTLELGGKSPAIVWKDTDVAVAARRLAWGKFMNAGQTCIAPDYVLVQADIEERLFAEISTSLKKFYGEDAKNSPDYCRIVNDRNFSRLTRLLEADDIAYGGRADPVQRYIEPTLMRMGLQRAQSAPVMHEEIFGPILPLIKVETLEEALSFINARPKPLALYLFSGHDDLRDRVVSETSAGGVCINDVVVHMPSVHMPFGGVGESGMGSYHGQRSFATFTHQKAVMTKSLWPDIPLRYAPYSERKRDWMRRLS